MNDSNQEHQPKHPPRMTLLPQASMNIGMPDSLGIVAVQGEHASHWLTDVADGMTSTPSDASLPLPIVLAAEEQLCRVLVRASADDRGAVDAWRGLLAIALLWDVWAKEDDSPVMTVERFDGRGSAFSSAAVHNAGHTLQVLALSRGSQRIPLGLIGSRTLLTPAATPADLNAWLPARVGWYDREARCMQDPCRRLNERDRSVLTARLQQLLDDAEPNAPLTVAVKGCLAALTDARQAETDAFTEADEDAAALLEIRVKAVCGLLGDADFPMLTCREECYAADSHNPLLDALASKPISAPAEAFLPQRTYLWRGIPFARSSAIGGFTGTNHPMEAEAIREIGDELALLEDYDAAWNRRLSEALTAYRSAQKDTASLVPAVAQRIAAWQSEALERAAHDAETPLLCWPWPEDSGAVRRLSRHALGDAAAVSVPFADRLCMLENAPEDALGDVTLSRVCRLPCASDKPATVVIPPLSTSLAELLTERFYDEGVSMPLTGLCFERGVSGDEAALRVTITLRGQERITLRRVYTADEWVLLDSAATPTVAVWPSLPFPADRWKAYFVYAHRAADLEVLTLTDSRWQAGTVREAPDGEGIRTWQVSRTSCYPAYLLLMRDGLTLGALPNQLPPCTLPVGEDVVAALDFGTTGTTVMLRQGGRVEPLTLDCLQRTLLHGLAAAPLVDEFLPSTAIPPILSSAEETFTDAPTQCCTPLVDGHLYLPSSLAAIADKDAGHLFYDLKWSTEASREPVSRLYLHQVMLQASLKALLLGAPGLSWRITLPNAMAEVGRASFFRLMASLADTVAEDTGMPLTHGVPSVSCAAESAAAGMYFRAREEVNLRGGFVTLDVGGGSAELSLWLRGMDRPAAECSLPMGAQFMLLNVLLAHPDRLTEDFGDAEAPQLAAELSALVSQLRVSRGSLHALHKSRLMLDAFIAAHMPLLMLHMNKRLSEGRITLTQSLLLLSFAFLLTLTGLIQQQAYEDPLLNDLLPGYMEICLAGRGCLLMLGFADTLQARLKHFIRLSMSDEHPTRDQLLFPSAAPKAEVATGLLRLPQLCADPTLPNAAKPPRRRDEADPMLLMQRFLYQFRTEFPDAADKLFPGLYADNGAALMTRSAEKKLRAILDAQFSADSPLPVRYAAVLMALRAEYDL